MKYSALPYIPLLSLIAILLSTNIYAQKDESFNKLEIFIESFEKEERVKNVVFELYKNGEEFLRTTSKNGRFSFVIQQSAAQYKLIAQKKGYLTKEILFNTKDFPFDKEYAYQDLFLEFIPLSKNDTDYVYTGRMVYEAPSRSYKVEKIDSSRLELEKKYKDAVNRLEEIYSSSITNGDGLAQLEEYKYAKDFYKTALTAKPDDEYAQNAIERMDSLIDKMELTAKAEREKALGEDEGSKFEKEDFITADSVPEDDEPEESDKPQEEQEEKTDKRPAGEYYSVQLGAFIDWYDESTYEDVPDKIVAQGADYKRVLSGRFNDRDKAKARMEEMKAAGFSDAFLVTMKGEERIGF